MRRQREREVTYAVEAAWSMPDVGELTGPGGTVETATEELRAVYYDTADATLRRLGITLRQRSGGHDAGWHLKVATGPARTEYQSRARSRRVPDALTRRVAGVLAGRELVEVATISTVRRATRLLDADGTLRAEIADDAVDGVGVGEVATLDRWREVEVELGPAGDEDLLAAFTGLFGAAGAEPAAVQRKLDRLLGELGPAAGGTPTTTGGAVAAYAQEQARAILLGELAVRDRPDPEAVHQTRVGIRRLRSTLRNFGSALAVDDAAADGLDDDLRWLAALLSPIRDSDILARRLNAEVGELPPERVLGPVVREIEEALAAERTTAIAAWRTAAGSDERYVAVMRTLGDWLVAVPLADAPSEGKKVLAKARATARRRLKQAEGDPHRLHRARKAVKRLRYAGELLDGVVPKAARTAKRAKKRQTALGGHQDLVVAADFLQRQGAQVGTRPGHNGFTYGLLLARVEERAARIRASL